MREDEKRVLRQRRWVLELRAKGANSRIAEELLQVFADILAVRRANDSPEGRAGLTVLRRVIHQPAMVGDITPD